VKVLKKFPVFIIAAVFLAAASFPGSSVQAAGTSIVVLDMQKALSSSEAGKKAQQVMEKKVKELEEKFKAEEAEFIALQEEIEKKSSVWSEEKKQDKIIELQKKRRDFRVKQDDANLEFQALQEKQLAPIAQEMGRVVEKLAKEKGYKIVLPKRAVFFTDATVEITDEVTKALNAVTK